jgi:hypothetical protein
MALIRATCSECGDVELRSRDLKVRTCVETSSSTYLFRCPVCRMTEVKGADEQIVDILAAAGVPCITWRLPQEIGERPAGEPISHDDVLDFHDLLGGDTWYETLAAMTKLG